MIGENGENKLIYLRWRVSKNGVKMMRNGGRKTREMTKIVRRVMAKSVTEGAGFLLKCRFC